MVMKRNWLIEIDMLEGKDISVYQKKKLPQKDKEGNPIILPVLPPKRIADPEKPLYIKKSKKYRGHGKYDDLWKKVNSECKL